MMHPAIRVSVEGKRGCGWRKVGGLYFRCGSLSRGCGRFPLPLGVCPCCGAGIRPARGYTWIMPQALVQQEGVRECATPNRCGTCPVDAVLNGEIAKVGLLWVGEQYYPTPGEFLNEASEMGVSRRLPSNQVPRGFVVGESWVMLAHRKAVVSVEFGKEPVFTPGIFAMFKPDRIEVVVDGTETDEEIDALVKRGLTPVLVQRAGEQLAMILDEPGSENEV